MPNGASTQSRIGPIPDDELPSKPAVSKPSASAQSGAAEAASTPDRQAHASTEPVAAPVSHMVSNYAGVGKRTAEVLFEHFGDDVFNVIDREPKRVSEVISEGRAKVVIEARRTERES